MYLSAVSNVYIDTYGWFHVFLVSNSRSQSMPSLLMWIFSLLGTNLDKNFHLFILMSGCMLWLVSSSPYIVSLGVSLCMWSMLENLSIRTIDHKWKLQKGKIFQENKWCRKTLIYHLSITHHDQNMTMHNGHE